MSGCTSKETLCSTGPGDDAAVLSSGLTITTDSLVQGVHWDDRLTPFDVGWKSVCVSVSDLAAMGVQPQWLTCSISLPTSPDLHWTKEFARGLHAASKTYAIELIGGDTTTSPGPIFVNITMGGVTEVPAITRSGANAGDSLWVTGIPGLAAAGYYCEDPFPDALYALTHPTPPLRFARRVAVNGLVSAMMDLSDGLASDLPKLCHASGVGATVESARLPQHPKLSEIDTTFALRLAGGDDFQLLFTAPPNRSAGIIEAAKSFEMKATCIGTITSEKSVRVDRGHWPTPPWSHFSSNGASS